ncbi:MAG: EAL domain-containing protein [Gammaproteobacteria bacterium]|nr:EAL domain-containing protein [Gammaproteobacteria bacterium]
MFDIELNLSWASDSYSGPQTLPQTPRDVLSSGVDGILLIKDDAGRPCYLHTLQIYRNDSAAFVVLQFDRQDELSRVELDNLVHQLKIVQLCISQVNTMQGRLDKSVSELRYFQYQSNVVETDKPVVNSDHEIALLLNDCCSSMALAGAFLFYADEKRIFSEVIDEAVFGETGLDAKRRSGMIQRELYRLCESSSAAFTLANDSAGASAPKKDLDSLQIIASPLLDAQKQPVGALILVREREANRFGKSDCRLAELMSEKAVRISQSRYDKASGFLNEITYGSMLQQQLVDCKTSLPESTFLLLRLDRLSEAYALGGVEAGQHLISQVAALLGQRVRSRDLAGRLGHDEFALLLKNCKADDAMLVADQILESLSACTFDWQGQLLGIDANIGLVTLSQAFVSQENLIRAGREAVTDARKTGNFKAGFFNGLAGKAREVSKIDWDHRIYKAVINGQFRLFCQPIGDAANFDDGIRRYELLFRPDSEDGVLMAPSVFISTARKLGLMRFVDQWVVHQAFALAAQVNADFTNPQYRFSINLAGDSMTMAFADFVLNQAEASGVHAEAICFDITEAAAMQDLRQTNSFINLLKKRGFEFALDDFGTGIGAYSSLRNLPVDYVKLNGQLVKNITHDPVSEAIVLSLASVCRSIGIRTIAESVENEAIRERLAQSGVNFVQGFQAGRPRAVEIEFQGLQQHGSGKVGSGS